MLPKQNKNPEAGLSERSQRAIEQGRVYRLYIASSDAKISVPEENLYIVKNAPPEKLAEILSLLFPAEGPGRSPNMSFLLYKNQDVWTKAIDFASKLDVSDASAVGDPWQNGLALLYKSKFPRKLSPQDRYKITLQMNRVLNDTKRNSEIRWASGIIIAALNVRFSPKDYTLAGATLGLSSRIISEENYEMMVIQYHQIVELSLQGKKTQSQAYARETLDTYRNWSNTACFELIADYIK